MRKMVALLVLVLVGTMDTQPTIIAQGPSIQVLSQSVESHFPDDLTFHLLVRSDAGDIVKAELYLQVGWEETITWVVPESFMPGAEVNLTAVWGTFAQTIPPFTEITYHWQVMDSTGQALSTESMRTEYTDATHDWHRLEDEHNVVLWYDWPVSVGQVLFEASQEAYDHVTHITGVTIERPIRVVIYGSQEDFCAFFAPRTCQDWIGGQTSSGITVQWGSIQNLEWFTDDVIPHELAHVFYGEIFRDLPKLEPGDEVRIYTDDATFRYIVNTVEIVEPTRVEVMDPTDYPILTMITCYPYLLDTHRVVVVADLAE